MTRLTFIDLPNDQGQDLLEHWVAPLCRRLGVELVVAGPDRGRATARAAQASSDFVLWDCSVEGEERVYRALHNWAKTTRKHLFVSRTPMPRNVLARHQFAPIHGRAFSNAEIGEWLERYLRTSAAGERVGHATGTAGGQGHYWMFDNPADYFLSFRGSHQRAAEQWRADFERSRGATVRMVPPAEFAYPTEVVTQQQMWEGVARLLHEIKATRRVLFFGTDDYFDSFWTCSELLLTLWLRTWKGFAPWLPGVRVPRGPGHPVFPEAFFATSDPSGELIGFDEGLRGAGVPLPSEADLQRVARLVNNGDPVTSAPETQIPPSGPAKLLALALRPLGFYVPEFTSDDFWNIVRVPCPRCRPLRRKPETIDWARHLELPDSTPSSDYFGYFPAQASDLAQGSLRCPRCGSALRIINRRGVRTLWVPVQTTEKDQDRPVIQAHRVWEVEA